MAGHCCYVVILVDEEIVVVVSGESVNEFDEHFLWRRARLELLLVVVLMVFCQPIMPNGHFRTVFVSDFSHVGSVVEMRRIRGAVAVPGWGWPLWWGLGLSLAMGGCLSADR